MVKVEWSYQLRDGERANPVVTWAEVSLAGLGIPEVTDEQAEEILPGRGHRLRTWARLRDAGGKVVVTNDPHFIAVRGSTPLHRDPRYPRYSHHLKLRADPGIVVRGMSLEELPLTRGTFYVLDAHSPHQVLCREDPAALNIAVSIDSHRVEDSSSILPALLAFAANAPFLPFR